VAGSDGELRWARRLRERFLPAAGLPVLASGRKTFAREQKVPARGQ
jgi:hypothetical protein